MGEVLREHAQTDKRAPESTRTHGQVGVRLEDTNKKHEGISLE